MFLYAYDLLANHIFIKTLGAELALILILAASTEGDLASMGGKVLMSSSIFVAMWVISKALNEKEIQKLNRKIQDTETSLKTTEGALTKVLEAASILAETETTRKNKDAE
jgi:urease accessory protein UreH